MRLEFKKTAPGVMVASWTYSKSGRSYSIAAIESCDTWHTFIDGEWIARDLPSFEEAAIAAEMKLTPKGSPKMIRVAGVLLAAAILGASAVVASKFVPAISSAEVATVTRGDDSSARRGQYTANVKTTAPDEIFRSPAASKQPLPVRRELPALQPSAHRF